MKSGLRNASLLRGRGSWSNKGCANLWGRAFIRPLKPLSKELGWHALHSLARDCINRDKRGIFNVNDIAMTIGITRASKDRRFEDGKQSRKVARCAY